MSKPHFSLGEGWNTESVLRGACELFLLLHFGIPDGELSDDISCEVSIRGEPLGPDTGLEG